MKYTEKRGYFSDWQQKLYLQQNLCEIQIRRHTQCGPIAKIRGRWVLAYIDEDPCRSLALEELISVAGIGKTWFIESFRQLTFLTPMQCFIEKRLEFDRELLFEMELHIARNAEEADFPIRSFFGGASDGTIACLPVISRRRIDTAFSPS
ncbi:MAG: hypothetical protein ACI3XP_03275 [Eubacteriales bacterium]